MVCSPGLDPEKISDEAKTRIEEVLGSSNDISRVSSMPFLQALVSVQTWDIFKDKFFFGLPEEKYAAIKAASDILQGLLRQPMLWRARVIELTRR